MRVPFKELLEKCGVFRVLSAYETNPWFHYDDDEGITCSAEIRVGPDAKEAEAEIQYLYDDPAKHEKTNPDQIFIMRMAPVKDDLWSPHFLKVKGEDYVNALSEWEKKGCEIFLSCIQSLQMGELPDIDALVKKHLGDDGSGRTGGGRIGRKSPKINASNVLGMKKGM